MITPLAADRALRVLATILASLLLITSQAVAAQAVTGAPPIDDPADSVDDNLINVITGKVNIQSADLVIGQTGEATVSCWRNGGWEESTSESCSAPADGQQLNSEVDGLESSSLELIRYWTSESVPFGGNQVFGWHNNWTSSIGIDRGKISATFGNQAFYFASATMSSSRGDGATILALGSNSYQVTTRDGTKLLYGANFGPVTLITYANGRTINITYASRQGCGNAYCMDFVYYRIQQVHSSDNLALHFEYASDNSTADNITQWMGVTKVTGFNKALESCAPSTVHCTFANVWPDVQYTIPANTPSAQMTSRSPEGEVTTYETYGGHITRIVDPTGAEAYQFLYGYYGTSSPKQHLVTGVVRAGSTWTYNPNPANSLSALASPLYVTAPNGGVSIYEGTTQEGLKKFTDPLGNITAYLYDTKKRLVEISAPEGDKLRVTYDTRGNVTERRHVAKPSSGLADIVLTAGFEAGCATAKTCNKPLWTTDARGNVTDYTYDTGHGGVLTVTRPADPNGVRPQVRYAYSLVTGAYRIASISSCMTLSTCANTSDEAKQVYAYSTTNGYLTSVTNTTGAGGPSQVASVGLDNLGNMISSTDPNGVTGYFFYDKSRRLIGTIGADPDGAGSLPRIAHRFAYDDRGLTLQDDTGNVTGTTLGDLTSMTPFRTDLATYDGQGRATSRRAIASATTHTLTQYSYDTSGRLECTAVRMNTTAFGSLPASACSLGTSGSQGADRITKNVYDVADRLTQVREGVGTSTEAAEVSFSYTNNGKLQFVVDAGGHKALKCYDGFDRQVRWVLPSTANPGAFNDATPASALSSSSAVNGDCTASAGDFEQYGYDNDGNRTSLRKRDGSVLAYQFDALGRMTLKIVPERSGLSATHTRDVYYSYDLRGLQTSARFDSNAGEGVISAYDAFGRLQSSTNTLDGVSRVLSYGYDAAGNRRQLTYPDGTYVYYHPYPSGEFYYATIGNSQPLFHDYPYASGALYARYRLDTSTGAWHQATGYTYDAIQRPATSWHELAGTTYDTTTTFTYNPASQIASTTRNNDNFAWNGQVTVGRNYTANGLNQYSAVGGVSFGYDTNGNLTSDGTNTYVYDVENRLVTRSGGASATVRYDPLGRLYEVAGSAGTTRFLHDGSDLVAEYTTGNPGTLLRRYVHGLSAGDDPLVWFEGSSVADSARRYLYADERGSIVAVTNSSGTLTAIGTYDEYGLTNNTLSSDLPTYGRFRYTGQAYIPELGLSYYKARMYSPSLGRFMQTDPIGYGDQYNLYAYVYNDPVNNTDPTGECGPLAPVCAAAGGAVVGATVRCAVSAPCRAGVVAGLRWIIRSQRPRIGPIGSEVSPQDNAEQPRERAKDRRARQRAERAEQRAQQTGGEPDSGGDGTPGNNQAQNRVFRDIVKEKGLTPEQARKLHEEITGQNLGRDEILERVDDMFPSTDK